MNVANILEHQISLLPKGSITKKTNQGKERYYLQWREGDKVKNRYVSLSELPTLSAQIAKRKELQQKLAELQVSSIQQISAGLPSLGVAANMAADNRAVYEPNGFSVSWNVELPKNSRLADLVGVVDEVSKLALQGAHGAVNRMQTIRNWLIGQYIVEYEQNGLDRAKYGTSLLKTLESKVKTKGLNVTLFQLCRRFYLMYPEIANVIYATPSHKSVVEYKVPPEQIVNRLSFSHIRECMSVANQMARYFYESECIKCCWSVKELRRQISTCLYERFGLSKNPQKLLKQSTDADNRIVSIQDPFTFEFLNISPLDVVHESDLENGLIEHLQSFILELGRGFCFEARQKRLIIDDCYYFADLVFYNRLLHCSVIIELKNDEFKHEYLGQLNAYVSYYKEHEMQPGDNPPIGILLCTRKGPKMVEYAMAGMDNKLFVSTYKLKLPTKKELIDFLKANM